MSKFTAKINDREYTGWKAACLFYAGLTAAVLFMLTPIIVTILLIALVARAI